MSQIPPIDNVSGHIPEVNNAKSAQRATDPNQVQRHEQDTHRLAELLESPNTTPKEILTLFRGSPFQDIKTEALGMILNLGVHDLDVIITDLIMILRAEFGGGSPSVNIYFLAAILERVSEYARTAPQIIQSDIKLLLSDLKSHQNELVRYAVQQAILKTEGAVKGAEGVTFSDRASTQVGATATPLVPTQMPMIVPNVAIKGFTERDFGNYRELVSTDKSIQINVSNNSRDASAEIVAGTAAVSMHGGAFKMGFTNAIATIGNLPPVFMVSPIVNDLLGRLEKIQDRQNLYKFAIVTDSVVSMGKEERPDYLRLIDHSREFTPDKIADIYRGLIEEGYQRIISLHLSPKLSRSYVYAKQAAEEIGEEAEIKVINSHANGLGLGLMVREIKDAISHHYSPLDIYHLIQEFVHRIQYWVVPMSFDYVKNHKWVSKVLDNKEIVKLKMFQFKPVISLSDEIRVEDSFKDEESALHYILTQVAQLHEKRRGKFRRIGVEYRRVYRKAVDLNTKLKAHYQTVPVSTHVAGSITNSLFGPDLIGVCII